MTKKPIVLIIENSIDVTGALKSITRSAYDLQDSFEFQFVIPKRSKGRSWIEAKGFLKIYELPMIEVSRRINSLLLYIPYLAVNSLRLKKILSSNRVDILHVNDLYNLLPIAVRIWGCKIPYICHIRFLPDKFPEWLFKFWLYIHLKYADRVIAVSQSVFKLLPKHPKIEVIPNELPVEEKYPETIKFDERNSKMVFLYLSNYMLGKGQNYALEAFAKIHHTLPNWKLKFVGSDMGLKKNSDFLLELESKAVQLGIDKKIEWFGFTEEVEKAYKEADIVLNFSESESFSITCLEALFFGRPLIATDCGGPAEIIDHEKTGVLVPNRNVDSMANAMKQMALNEGLRIEMGQHARKVVREKFRVEKTSLRLKDVYETMLKTIG